MSCSRTCRVFDGERAKEALIGSIVVETRSVGFYTFRANSNVLVKGHRVPVQRVTGVRPGRAEQDPAAVLAAVRECVSVVVTTEASVAGLKVAAVGLANHRGSVMAWNRVTGAPLSNVVLWSDNRTEAVADRYARAGGLFRFQRTCGLPFSPRFSVLKIRWLLDNDERVRLACRDGVCAFGTVDAWLVWNLTGGIQGGVFATDSTNAAHTFLMNINTIQWDTKLLKFFGIPYDTLPEIKTSSEIYGSFTDGPLANVPISGVVGIRQAALIGQKCFRRGIVKASLDESGSVLAITGENKVFSEHGLLTTIGYQLDERPVYALEGPIASVGQSIEWCKHCFKISENECMISEKQVKAHNPLYFIPAFIGLHAPHWRPDARSIFVGIDDCVRNGDLIKAAMESVAFQTQDVLGAMKKDLKMSIDKIRVDGGMSKNKFIMQSVSNLTNTLVEVPKFTEMTALGAAMAAGYAVEINLWNALCMPEEKSISYYPKITADERLKRMTNWTRAVRRSYDWLDFKKKSNHLWSIVSVVVGVSLLGGYFLLKK